MTKQAKMSRKVVLQIAAQTGSDPRTVERVAAGKPVKAPSLARILPALRALGLALVVFALGCDAESYSTQVVEPDAGTVEDPGAGPERGGPSTVFASPDVQLATPAPDAGTVATPDTMPTVAPDATPAPDTRPAVAVDTMPATVTPSACKVAKVFMANVCPEYWPGTRKPCVQSGQDYAGAVYGAIVKVGEQPCAAYAVGTAPYYSADVMVVPAGGCEFYCPKALN